MCWRSASKRVCPQKERNNVQKSIEVKVPVRTAYNQWTQFEGFPHFMEEVKRLLSSMTRICIGKPRLRAKKRKGRRRLQQTPDQRIAWVSRGGAIKHGAVMFQPLSDARSKIRLQVVYAPEGIVESVGDELSMVSRCVQDDLKRFKEFIEQHDRESGAWRFRGRGSPTHS